MSADAIALLRPKNPEALRPFLDLDDGDESDGLYAEELDDGAFLVHTFQPFAVFQADVDEGRVWLAQLVTGTKEGLSEVHDDPRGVLFFPDADAPEAETYDAIVSELEGKGVWIPALPLTREEATARKAALARDLAEAHRMVAALTGGEVLETPKSVALGDDHGDDELGAMHALAKNFLAENPDGATSFGAAKMLEDVQKKLMAAFGIAGGGLAEDTGENLVLLVRRKTELDIDEDDVEDAFRLDDGSIALHTYVPVASRSALVAELAGPRAAWVAEHDDPRGVPTFESVHLDDLTDVTSYDDVLERLGDHVTFVKP